jgi:hypothetical protein
MKAQFKIFELTELTKDVTEGARAREVWDYALGKIPAAAAGGDG